MTTPLWLSKICIGKAITLVFIQINGWSVNLRQNSSGEEQIAQKFGKIQLDELNIKHQKRLMIKISLKEKIKYQVIHNHLFHLF